MTKLEIVTIDHVINRLRGIYNFDVVKENIDIATSLVDCIYDLAEIKLEAAERKLEQLKKAKR